MILPSLPAALVPRPRPPAFALLALTALFFSAPTTLSAQDSSAVHAEGDSVVIKLVETDLRNAIAALSRYLPRTVIATGIPDVRVTLEPPQAVPRQKVQVLLKGLVEAHGLEFTEDEAYFRIAPQAVAVAPVSAAYEGNNTGPVRLFVVRLKHARASDVAATVDLLYGGSGSFSGSSDLSSGTLSEELRRQQAPAAPAGPDGTSGAVASFRGAVTIVPDELTNSLLIRADSGDYRVLSEAIDQLDIRPLQVLIEVLIVEARHDRSFSLGADLFLPRQKLDGGTIDGQLTGGGLGDLVIHLMGLGKAEIDATIRAAQSRGDVEIISRPVLLASNNTEARFLVGTQRPFVQVSRSLPTDTPTRDQVVQYRDVGTKLTVRPTINQDGYVSLILQQEINAATNETQFNAPVISTREASTQVLVRDGQTIVIGGLNDQQKDRNQGGIPLLSDIPILGGLFGSANRRSSQTELYIFVTPRIIRTDEDVDSVTRLRLPESDRAE